MRSHSFRDKERVVFNRTYVTGYPMEYEDWFPCVPAGTQGRIVDVQDDSVVVRIQHPLDANRKADVQLYAALPGRCPDEQGLLCIERPRNERAHLPLFAPAGSGFHWGPDACVPVPVTDAVPRARIPLQ